MMQLNKLSQLINHYFKLCTAAHIPPWLQSNMQRAIKLIVSAHVSSDEVKEWIEERGINTQGSEFISSPMSIQYEEQRVSIFSGTTFDYILSTSPLRDSEDNLMVESQYIPPYKSIPALYLSKVKEISPVSKLDPISAHNIFVVQALQKVVGLNLRNDEERKDISNFIKENIDTINHIRSFFQHAPKKLGQGADGIAFSISPFAVLKIFANPTAFDAAQQAMERLHTNPELAKTEAKIYDVGVLGECKPSYGYPTLVYYYIIEKMIPMESLTDIDTYDLINYIKSDVLDIVNSPSFPLRHLQQLLAEGKNKEVRDEIDYRTVIIEAGLRSHPSTREKIKKLEDQYVSNIQLSVDTSQQQTLSPQIKEVGEKSSQPFQLRSSWLSSLIEEIIMKRITNRTDLHMGNIGVTGYGDFRYFDPAFKEDSY